MRRGIWVGLATLALACLVSPAWAGAASGPTVDSSQTLYVNKVTGPGPLNLTDQRWSLYGADLGSMFEWHGRIYMAFGDSYGKPRPTDVQDAPDHIDRNTQHPTSALNDLDWRSNTMGYFSADQTNPAIGPLFEGMITDPGNPLRAEELLSSKKEDCANVAGPCEQTVIPTNGFAVGNRMFLHYMSVKQFNPPDDPMAYRLNYAGLAYSDDGGQTWIKDPSVTWAGNSNFGQVAAVQTGGRVYLFGIPGGRFGDVRLGRVDEDKVLNQPSYRYWDGHAWNSHEDSAVPIVPPRVGELSVRWNSYFGKWLMMYTDEFDPSPGLFLRTADCLTGPWSDPQLVVDNTQGEESEYAPFIPPRWNDGPDLYFAMSVFFNYNVYWMHTPLTGLPHPGRKPCVQP